MRGHFSQNPAAGRGGRRRAVADGLEDRVGHAVQCAGRLLAAPTPTLAEALAAEWDAQRDVIDPARMPLTRLANSIIDGVSERPSAVAAEIGMLATIERRRLGVAMNARAEAVKQGRAIRVLLPVSVAWLLQEGEIEAAAAPEPSALIGDVTRR